MAANGQNGGVSRRRLPTKPMELPADEPKPRAARLKPGDRARRLPNGPCGIVMKVERTRALMHWGTQSIPVGAEIVEKRFEDWVPRAELERSTTPVVSPDEVIKRQAMS